MFIFHRLKINHDSDEFILEFSTVANSYHHFRWQPQPPQKHFLTPGPAMIQESRSNRAWKMAPPTSGLKNVNQILVLAFCIKYPLIARDLFFNAKNSIIDCSLNIKGTPCKNIYCEPHTFPTEFKKKNCSLNSR
jgi:hypothetical protein